ncbi:MAG TPA: MFS transporter, partial [Panacibacter sp.]|nr:MFS transporter [Panacibacter sp.]
MLASNQSPRPARIAVSSFFFIAGICSASWASRIPDIQNELKLSEAGLGTVLFALPIGSMISLPLSGMLVAKISSRITMLIGAVFFTSLLCTLGLVTAVWELVTVLFFFGVAGNMMNISINTQAVGVEALYGRSVMASFHGLWSLAGFSGAAIGTLLIAKNIQPLIHFIVIAVLIGLIILITFRYLLKYDA